MVGSNRPILVVESDSENLEALCRLLRREFAVYAAANAWEALEILRQHEIHVIMAAQRLPEMSGMDLLCRVQRLWPETVQVALTPYTDLRAVIQASEQVELFRYLTKPWDGDEVRSVLHQACGQYDQAAARVELLSSLQSYQRERLEFLEGLRQGSFGELNLSGHLKVVELAAIGEALLDGLHTSPMLEADRETEQVDRQPASPSFFRLSTLDRAGIAADQFRTPVTNGSRPLSPLSVRPGSGARTPSLG